MVIACVLYIGTLQKLRVVCSTIPAEKLPLADGSDVAIYINTLLSEILHTKPNCLSITAYTENQSLWSCTQYEAKMSTPWYLWHTRNAWKKLDHSHMD